MTAVNDELVLHALLDDANSIPTVTIGADQVADLQLKYQNDINNRDYTSGQINIQMQEVAEFKEMKGGVVRIPYTIKSSLLASAYGGATSTGTNTPLGAYNTAPANTPYNFVTPTSGTGGTTNPAWFCPMIALKSSFLDLILGMTVGTIGGTQFINENNSFNQIINNFRLDIERNIAWSDSLGANIGYYPDKYPNFGLYGLPPQAHWGIWNSATNPGTGAAATVPSWVVNTPFQQNNTMSQSMTLINNTGTFPPTGLTNQIMVPNPHYNSGFVKRAQFLFENSVITTTVTANDSLTGDFFIPLVYLHDFFQQLNIPITNLSWDFKFQCPWARASTVGAPLPLVYDGMANPPVITIGYNGNSSSTTRLYYKAATLRASQGDLLNDKLKTGMSKYVNYITTNYKIFSVGQASTGGDIQFSISQGVVNPRRIVGFPRYASANTSEYTINAYQGTFRDLNLQVSNTQLWTMPFTGNWEQWINVYEQFFDVTGGNITYYDWLNYKHYLVFDLSRASNRLIGPGSAASVLIQGTKTDSYNNTSLALASASNIEIIYLIESETITKVDLSNNGAAVAVGQNPTTIVLAPTST